jgi:hypothetical protein
MILNFHTPHRLTIGGFVLACSLGLLAAPMWLSAQDRSKAEKPSSEKRLDELEKKVAALLDELRAAKGAVSEQRLPPVFSENVSLPRSEVAPSVVATAPAPESPKPIPSDVAFPTKQLFAESSPVAITPATKTVTYSVGEFAKPQPGNGLPESAKYVLALIEQMARDQQGCDMLVDTSDDKVVRVYSSPQVIEVLQNVQSLAVGTLGRKGKIRFTSTAPHDGQSATLAPPPLADRAVN